MKKVDVLFLYETKVRELENICLIKNELESRGYSVGVQNTWNSLGKKRHPYKAKVVVTHGMYHDGIYEFVQSLVGKAKKIVNMQCEQIGTMKDEEDQNSRFVLRGIASQCMNICWGDKTIKRLTEKSGIDNKHLRKTGQVTLDFCRKELKGYYQTREQLFEQYKINNGYQVNLFISSFAYVNLPKDIEKNSDMLDKESFIDISRKSFKLLLEWFSELLKTDPNQIIIYRPHPAEANNKDLESLMEKFNGRFFVISDFSVKQWISVVDRVYTWYSTSMAEVYAFGVPCAILRPVQIPEKMEIALFENASYITDYLGFINSLKKEFDSSISKDVFTQYYSVEEKMSYLRVADAIEEVFNDDSFIISYQSKKKKPSIIIRIKIIIFSILKGIKSTLPKKWKILEKFKGIEIDDYTLQLQKKNYASDKEIGDIQNKLKFILYSEGK